MKWHDSTVPYSIDRNCIRCYGREFKFSDGKSKDAAVQAAQQFGRDYQASMAEAKGAPLTARKRATGKLKTESKPEFRSLSSSSAESTGNPWLGPIADLAGKTEHTKGGKARQEMMLARMRLMSAQWEVQNQHKLELAAEMGSPERLRVLDYTRNLRTKIEGMPTAGFGDYSALDQLEKLANDAGTSTESFWGIVRDLNLTERRAPR